MQVRSAADSSAHQVAIELLDSLGITDPPLYPDIVLAGLDLTLEELPAFDQDRLTPEQRRLFRSVRALLSPSERRVYTSPTLSPRQQQWAIYHEAGHALIEWHRELLYLDDGYTLSPQTRNCMEQEANEFAGDLQFLGTRLAMEAKAFPLSLECAIRLAQRYNASFESTIHRYVATHQESCICRVLRIVVDARGEQTLQFHYFVRSTGPRCQWYFPYHVGSALPASDPFVRRLHEGTLRNEQVIEEVTVEARTGMVYRHQLFCNGHAVFVLTAPVYP